MQYVTRAGWGARSPKATKTIPDTSTIYIHHSVTAGTGGDAEVRGIQRFHMDERGWADIAYNWLVDDNGTIWEGRGWHVQGGATKGRNRTSIAICYLGNADKLAPSIGAKHSINTLIAEATEMMGVQTVRGHREAPGASTQCPGKYLVQWLADGRPNGSVTEPMAWQDKTQFITAVEQTYRYTGPNYREASPEDMEYYVGEYNKGTDPDWLLRALAEGLRNEGEA
jgi:hypothetical protein